jgi:hypothetical protein
MASSSSTSSLRSAAKPHSNTASVTASPALPSAAKAALGNSQSMKSLSLGATAGVGAGSGVGGGIGSPSDKQGRFESDGDFADRTRTVHSVRVVPGRAPPLALNAHGLLTVALERLQLPATQRAFFPRVFLFEGTRWAVSQIEILDFW